MNSSQARCVTHQQSSPLLLLPTVIIPLSSQEVPVHTSSPTDNLSPPQRAQTQTGLPTRRCRAAAEAPPLRDALHAWEIRKAVPPADRGPLPYATASRAASLHPPSWLLTFYFSVCLFVFPEKKTHHQHQSLHVQLCGRAANVTDEFVMF